MYLKSMAVSNSSLDFLTPIPWKPKLQYNDSFTFGRPLLTHVVHHPAIRATESLNNLANIGRSTKNSHCCSNASKNSNVDGKNCQNVTCYNQGVNLDPLDCGAILNDIYSNVEESSVDSPICGSTKQFFSGSDSQRIRDRFRQRLAACQLGMAELQALRNKHKNMVAQIKKLVITDGADMIREHDATSRARQHCPGLLGCGHHCHNLSPTPSTGDVSNTSYRSSVSMDSGCCLSNDLCWSERSFGHQQHTCNQPTIASPCQSLANACRLPKMSFKLSHNSDICSYNNDSQDMETRSISGHASSIGDKATESKVLHAFNRPLGASYSSTTSLWNCSQTDTDETPPKPPFRYRRRGLKPPKEKRPSSLYTYPEENIICVERTGSESFASPRIESRNGTLLERPCNYTNSNLRTQPSTQQMMKSANFVTTNVPINPLIIYQNEDQLQNSSSGNCAQGREGLLSESEEILVRFSGELAPDFWPTSRSKSHLIYSTPTLTTDTGLCHNKKPYQNDVNSGECSIKICEQEENLCESNMDNGNRATYETIRKNIDMSPGSSSYSSGNKEEISLLLAARNKVSQRFPSADQQITSCSFALIEDNLKLCRRSREKSWHESPNL